MSDPLLSGKRCFVLDDEFLIALDIQQISKMPAPHTWRVPQPCRKPSHSSAAD